MPAILRGMTAFFEAVSSWPAVAAVAVVLLFVTLIVFVACRSAGKSRVRIFGRLVEIEHDGKPDNTNDIARQ